MVSTQALTCKKAFDKCFLILNVQNGARRRTPGGVFLFLLKHNEEIDKEDKKAIFLVEKKAAIKERKNLQAVNREKKVEELKKTLNRQAADNELPTRSDLMNLSHLKPETHSTRRFFFYFIIEYSIISIDFTLQCQILHRHLWEMKTARVVLIFIHRMYT